VRGFFVDNFLIAVEREVVALCGDVDLGHTETLRGARAVKFTAIAGSSFSSERRQLLAITLTPTLSRKRSSLPITPLAGKWAL